MRTYQPVGRDLAPCGTAAAYKRHLRHGEPACDDCLRANRIRKAAAAGHGADTLTPDFREIRNGIPWKPYTYNGPGYDRLEMEALLQQVIHVLACMLGAGRQQP